LGWVEEVEEVLGDRKDCCWKGGREEEGAEGVVEGREGGMG